MGLTGTIFDKGDLDYIRSRGMTPEKVLAQIEAFKMASPFQRMLRPCTIGDGIVCLEHNEIERLCRIYEDAALSGRAMKFVPASGAASRMFKPLLSYNSRLSKNGNASVGHKSLLIFVEEIERFPFYEQLQSVMAKNGLDIKKAVLEGDFQTILDYTLGPQGLNLADLPKGLIPFHRYPGSTRTAIEEHMVEAAAYDKRRRDCLDTFHCFT
jgi:hypothetical protein